MSNHLPTILELQKDKALNVEKVEFLTKKNV